jgi:transposase
MHRSPQGRPLQELRHRIDGIFYVAATNAPWKDLPAEFGKPDTVSRYFRRLTHAGVWPRLLEALADAAPAHPLRLIEHRICRACRRAYRILGLRFILFVRNIGLRSALPGPPWMLPDHHLSETLAAIKISPPHHAPRGQKTRFARLIASLKRLQQAAGGRAHIPRAVRAGWP